MNFACPNCNKTGSIDNSTIPEAGVYAICPQCRTKFMVKLESPRDFEFEPVEITTVSEDKTTTNSLMPNKENHASVLSKKEIRYLLAVLACFALCFVFILIVGLIQIYVAPFKSMGAIAALLYIAAPSLIFIFAIKLTWYAITHGLNTVDSTSTQVSSLDAFTLSTQNIQNVSNQNTTKPLENESVINDTNIKQFGVRWLYFWNYFSLPLGTLAESLAMFAGGLVLVVCLGSAILHAFVIYGLHKRRIWAWKWNWVIIAISYLVLIIPTQVPGTNLDSGEMIALCIFKSIAGALFWLWPNYVYWTKRKCLFDGSNTCIEKKSSRLAIVVMGIGIVIIIIGIIASIAIPQFSAYKKRTSEKAVSSLTSQISEDPPPTLVPQLQEHDNVKQPVQESSTASEGEALQKHLERQLADAEASAKTPLTASDTRTGLIWVRNCNIGGAMNWSDAVEWTKNLNYAGYSDWRLPTKQELESLAKRGGKHPVAWLEAQGFINIQAFNTAYYWTSDKDSEYSSWVVSINDGTSGTSLFRQNNHVWPVRGGR